MARSDFAPEPTEGLYFPATLRGIFLEATFPAGGTVWTSRRSSAPCCHQDGRLPHDPCFPVVVAGSLLPCLRVTFAGCWLRLGYPPSCRFLPWEDAACRFCACPMDHACACSVCGGTGPDRLLCTVRASLGCLRMTSTFPLRGPCFSVVPAVRWSCCLAAATVVVTWFGWAVWRASAVNPKTSDSADARVQRLCPLLLHLLFGRPSPLMPDSECQSGRGWVCPSGGCLPVRHSEGVLWRIALRLASAVHTSSSDVHWTRCGTSCFPWQFDPPPVWRLPAWSRSPFVRWGQIPGCLTALFQAGGELCLVVACGTWLSARPSAWFVRRPWGLPLGLRFFSVFGIVDPWSMLLSGM